MKKDNTLYVRNMIEKAGEAISFCKGKTFADFFGDAVLQSAVVMKLIVIGEEARKVPSDISSHIALPWQMIVGFRNMAVHEYFDLDMEQVWTTVTEDLPDLVEKCDTFLAQTATK